MARSGRGIVASCSADRRSEGATEQHAIARPSAVSNAPPTQLKRSKRYHGTGEDRPSLRPRRAIYPQLFCGGVTWSMRGSERLRYRTRAMPTLAPASLHSTRSIPAGKASPRTVRRYARRQVYRREPAVMPRGHQRVARGRICRRKIVSTAVFLCRKCRARMRP